MKPQMNTDKDAQINIGVSLRSPVLSFLSRLLGCAMLLFSFSITTAHAQDPLPPPPLPIDSTPLNELLTDTERASLAAAKNDHKKLIETYLNIAEAHLNSALGHAKNDNSPAAVTELDIYNKAIAEAGKVTFERKENQRKHSKKLEQALYKQIKTLEVIERRFPVERQPFAEDALKRAKYLRVQALNTTFAGGEILKEPDEPDEKKPPAKSGPPNNNQLLEPIAWRGGMPQIVSPPFQRRVKTLSLRRNVAQIPGDYLTEEEDDHVREAQEADKRIKVFMKIADRRLVAINGTAVTPTDKKALEKAEQEKREWGVLPKLSRAELLKHYARAIEECIVKLEDAYERNPKSSAIPKALTALRDSTDKHLEILRSLTSQVNGEAEDAALRDAIEQAETANKGARDGLK